MRYISFCAVSAEANNTQVSRVGPCSLTEGFVKLCRTHVHLLVSFSGDRRIVGWIGVLVFCFQWIFGAPFRKGNEDKYDMKDERFSRSVMDKWVQFAKYGYVLLVGYKPAAVTRHHGACRKLTCLPVLLHSAVRQVRRNFFSVFLPYFHCDDGLIFRDPVFEEDELEWDPYTIDKPAYMELNSEQGYLHRGEHIREEICDLWGS